MKLLVISAIVTTNGWAFAGELEPYAAGILGFGRPAASRIEEQKSLPARSLMDDVTSDKHVVY
jgi:hypothetical protein